MREMGQSAWLSTSSFILQGSEGRVNATETGIGCNDWISWNNNYSVLPASDRGAAHLWEESRISLRSVPCCDFSSRLLPVSIHTRHWLSTCLMTQRRSAKTNSSRVRISPVWIGTGWRNMGPA